MYLIPYLFYEEEVIESMKGYLTVDEVASKWKITPRRVRKLCIEGCIDGAEKFGFVWAVPVDAEKPGDRRVTTGQYRNWRNKHSKNKSKCEDDRMCPSDVI